MILDTFDLNGKKMLIRYPKLSDYKELRKFYNKTIEESLNKGGQLSSIKPVTPKQEKEWTKRAVESIKKKNSVYILAEANGKIIGSASVERVRNAHGHVGTFGIVILEKFTGK